MQRKFDICESASFLLDFGFPGKLLETATRNAFACGTTAADELIAFSALYQNTYYRLLAKHLDVRFVTNDEIEKIYLHSRDPLAALHPNNIVWGYTGNSTLRAIVAPSTRLIGRLEKMVAVSERTDRIVITSPSILKSVISKEIETELTEDAVNRLAIAEPLSSARFGADAWQGAILIILIGLIVAFGSLQPSATALGIHLLVSLFFFSCVVLRLLATLNHRKHKIASIEPTSNRAKPIYSVMVALLDEAEVVPDLIKAMRALRWPRAKLEIKLVCEAGDQSTIDALRAEELDARFEIITVPKSDPQTKPKALCYALGFSTGKYITVYDAEDRPHPEQLLEAYSAFTASDEKLACVQAPLVSANPQRNFWTALFHFEYSGLFKGLLPWLASIRAPILLGGTSNHFRRAALLDIGAWDPHNVTEDADLGLRIWRKGYRTDMITRPTWEDAPTEFKTWLPQRTRWLKGWMQTWIVQIRQPLALQANMSLSAFIITQILLTGTIVSALLHPIVLVKAIALTIWFVSNATGDIWITSLAIVDWLTVICAYMGFIALCWKSTDSSTRRYLRTRQLLVPIYWVAISIAAWRALHQLIYDPYRWEKTPHTRHEKSP